MIALARLVLGMGLLSLTLASAIPQGWMPVIGADERILLVICTDEGPQERWVDLNEPSPPPHEQTDERHICAFAGHGVQAMMPTADAVQILPRTMTARWHRATFTHRSAGFLPRYDARGPPHFS